MSKVDIAKVSADPSFVKIKRQTPKTEDWQKGNSKKRSKKRFDKRKVYGE